MLPRSYTYDAALQLKDAGLVAADAAGAVGGTAKIVDLGSATANFSGVLIVDVSAIEIASNDELYHIALQGSNTSDFSGAKQILALLSLGATEVRPGGAIDSSPGRYEVPFVNMQDEVIYRYVRIHTDVAGSIATGINFTARIAQADGLLPS